MHLYEGLSDVPQESNIPLSYMWMEAEYGDKEGNYGMRRWGCPPVGEQVAGGSWGVDGRWWGWCGGRNHPTCIPACWKSGAPCPSCSCCRRGGGVVEWQRARLNQRRYASRSSFQSLPLSLFPSCCASFLTAAQRRKRLLEFKRRGGRSAPACLMESRR